MTASVQITPAAHVPWSAIEHVLGAVGESSHCWCRWWLTPNAEYSALDDAARRAALQADLVRDAPRGLLATVDGSPAAWVGAAPRPDYARLPRTKVLAPALPGTDWADDGVWSVVCFTVLPAHRRTGLATALLGAAVEAARTAGASAVEGYPIDTAVGGRRSPGALNTGTLALFERHGFTEVGRAKADRPVVRLDL